MAEKKFTPAQLSLMKLLYIEPDEQQCTWVVFKDLKKSGIVKGNFEQFLRQRLHATWAAERRASKPVYLGD